MFQIWSEKNNEAKTLLSPSLDLRDWNNLSREEKGKIWNYLKVWFEPTKEEEKLWLFISVLKLNELHKFQSYAKRVLENQSYHNASLDFNSIFLTNTGT